MMKLINGFSKFNKEKKQKWLSEEIGIDHHETTKLFENFKMKDSSTQKVFDSFSENTIGNFHLPYGIAPNMLINGKIHAIPMVIEESSVVAAVAHTAKYWSSRGGVKSEVLSTVKLGHIHFMWEGESEVLKSFISKISKSVAHQLRPHTESMNNRGGGVLSMELVDQTDKIANYYQIEMKFETLDAMGANFINTILEEASTIIQNEAILSDDLVGAEKRIDVIMCILSNYTPECLVKSTFECRVSDLGFDDNEEFARRFVQAVKIAHVDVHRATTHNKGVLNGIDAICIATGNDFRAIEASLHTYACRSGHYSALTDANIIDGKFVFEIQIPLALGTVGGLTKLHPLAKYSLEILNSPSAKELMQIVASVGLAQNFGALRALTTTGIQKGHMKMHLTNILDSQNVDSSHKKSVIDYFKDKVVSVAAVRDFIQSLAHTAAT
jgi:hydroxymethylglutaryl-CoA reductase